jgi:hypothetical protein
MCIRDSGKSVPFELKSHVLGLDADGDEITSCTITPAHGNIFAKPQPKGQSQQSALKVIALHIQSSPSAPSGLATAPANTACMKFEDAVAHLAGTLLNKEKHKRKNEARRLLTALTAGGFIGTTLDANQDTWCWVV